MPSSPAMSSTQIYSAKYSGVEVYELIHPTGSIMKRKADDWVNATHILKAAKFAKARRTRILEKEVIKDTHEKVQGGFGKYQGTWVPLDIARRLAQKFGVLDELSSLFDFTQRDGSATPPQAPKHHHASRSDSLKKRTTKTPPIGANTLNDVAVPRRRGRPPRNKKLYEESHAESDTLKRSQSDMSGFPRPAIPISSISSNHLPMIRSASQDIIGMDAQVMSGRQRKDTYTPQKYEELDIEDGLSSDVEVNMMSQHHSRIPINSAIMPGKEEPVSSSSSLPSSPSDFSAPIPFDNQRVGSATSPMLPRYAIQSRPQSSEFDQKTNDYLTKLIDYFINSELQTSNNVPIELLSPPHATPYIDAWIDSEHHTAFHWACAMGNLPIVEALLQAGSNYRTVNLAGETPLMRASMFHNSYTKRTYPRIFQLLQETVFDVDNHSQTVLHHIVKRRSNTHSALYYLDVLLSKMKDFSPQYRIEGLLNAQDNKGNTTLHIAAMNGDKKFFHTLLGNGALSTIKNNDGFTADEVMNRFVKVGSPTFNGYTQQQANIETVWSGSNTGSVVSTFPAASANSLSSFLPKNDIYPSTVATRISRAIPEVVNLMKDTAESYQKLYQDRLHELQEMKKMLKTISNTVAAVDVKILETLNIKDFEHVGDEMEKVRKYNLDLQNEFARKQKLLISILEKGQRVQLQTLLKDAEKEIDGKDGDPHVQSGFYNTEEYVNNIKMLTLLQLRRKAKRKQMLDLLCGNNKVHKFRKMISQGTDMELDEVDNFLDVILQQLNDEKQG